MNLKIKVLGIILDDKNNLLLIKENVPKKNKAFWNAIRGTYDNAKETLEETMLRECREEAGAEVIITESLPYHFERFNENKIRIYLPFVCKLKNSTVKLQAKDFQEKLNEEIIELRWFTKSEFNNINPSEFMEPFIYEIIKRYFNR